MSSPYGNPQMQNIRFIQGTFLFGSVDFHSLSLNFSPLQLFIIPAISILSSFSRANLIPSSFSPSFFPLRRLFPRHSKVRYPPRTAPPKITASRLFIYPRLLSRCFHHHLTQVRASALPSMLPPSAWIGLSIACVFVCLFPVPQAQCRRPFQYVKSKPSAAEVATRS
jgi:hypothetical protein